MLLSWIIKSIPRSPRAFLALLVMLGSTSLLFSGLQALFLPSEAAKLQVVLKLVIGLVIGLPATAVFYYFQHIDDGIRHQQNELDTLNRYVEADQRERLYKEAKATPVFNSQSGAGGLGSGVPKPGETAAAPDPNPPAGQDS